MNTIKLTKMTLQEITQFIDDRRIKGCGYGIMDEDGNLRSVLTEDFDAIGITNILQYETDRDIEILEVTYGGDIFRLKVKISEEEDYEDDYEEFFWLHPVTIYSSESVKQIVNSIQQDED